MSCRWYLARLGPKSEDFRLKLGDNVIGRQEESDVLIQSIFSSRKHCIITISDDNKSIIVKDLDTRNGTYINNECHIGKTITLKINDVIGIGCLTNLFGDSTYVVFKLKCDPVIDPDLIVIPDDDEDDEDIISISKSVTEGVNVNHNILTNNAVTEDELSKVREAKADANKISVDLDNDINYNLMLIDAIKQEAEDLDNSFNDFSRFDISTEIVVRNGQDVQGVSILDDSDDDDVVFVPDVEEEEDEEEDIKMNNWMARLSQNFIKSEYSQKDSEVDQNRLDNEIDLISDFDIKNELLSQHPINYDVHFDEIGDFDDQIKENLENFLENDGGIIVRSIEKDKPTKVDENNEITILQLNGMENVVERENIQSQNAFISIPNDVIERFVDFDSFSTKKSSGNKINALNVLNSPKHTNENEEVNKDKIPEDIEDNINTFKDIIDDQKNSNIDSESESNKKRKNEEIDKRNYQNCKIEKKRRKKSKSKPLNEHIKNVLLDSKSSYHTKEEKSMSKTINDSKSDSLEPKDVVQKPIENLIIQRKKSVSSAGSLSESNMRAQKKTKRIRQLFTSDESDDNNSNEFYVVKKKKKANDLNDTGVSAKDKIEQNEQEPQTHQTELKIIDSVSNEGTSKNISVRPMTVQVIEPLPMPSRKGNTRGEFKVVL